MGQPVIHQQKEHAMVKRALVSVAVFGLMLVSFSGYCSAEESPPEVISFKGTTGRPMEAPGVYPRLYSGAVIFNHEKHFSDYGPSCADCHHDDSGEPRTDLTSGMGVDNCIDCHDEEGLVYGRPADEMDEGGLIAHRANVVHRLCVGCHEGSSAEAQALVAPLACRGCHDQRERDYTLR
jgi:hypothetical protein